VLRSKRLSPIKKLAKNKEKNAAQTLASSLQRQNAEQAKLTQLQNYRLDYLNQMDEKVKQGITGSGLLQYHHFLAKLDLAIEQQKQAIQQSEFALQQSKTNWHDKRSKTKAITQVMDNMAVKEQKIKDKRESAQADEMSTQAFIRRQNKANH
jgi:flagellar protein FliJ